MKQEKTETPKKKTRKKNVRNAVYLLVALLLVGGLVLSATFGFIDFLARGGQPPMQPGVEGDELAALRQRIDIMEQSLEENPGDTDLLAELGYVYYQAAMLSWERGQGAEGERHAQQSKDRLIEATEQGFEEPWATLIVAILSMYGENQELAEEYFERTLEMDDEDPEVHLYYGIYLSSVDKVELAREHWQRVLELAEEDSRLVQVAEMYLEEGEHSEEPAEHPEPQEE